MAMGVALAANAQICALSTVLATALLTSPKLPELVKLNSERLGAAYKELTALLRRHGIRYMPCNAGLFVWACVAGSEASWEAEAEIVQALKEAGVIISGGKAYHSPTATVGWARIGFAVPPEVLQTAIQRMDGVFAARSLCVKEGICKRKRKLEFDVADQA